MIQLTGDFKGPIYRQIVAAVRAAVQSGELAPNQKLLPHLVLAQQLKVNPTTIRRAYELLENQGIIVRQHGSGTFVAADALRRLQRSGSREVGRVVVVYGVANLSQSPRETLFIAARLLDGFYQVMDGRAGAPQFVEALTAEVAEGLAEHDVVLLAYQKGLDAQAAIGLLARNVRIVALLDSATVPTVPRIDYDRHQAVSIACQHLVDCGYRRIGYLGRKRHWIEPVSPKFAAYVSTLNDAGLDIAARHVRDVDIAPGAAYAATQSILAEGDLPDAFFVDTDYKAMEAIRALNDAGLRVPQDIGVAAYDDILESAAFSPPLTTVHTPIDEIGRLTAQMLLDWTDTRQAPRSATLPARLVVRDSTLKLAAPKLGQGQ